MKVLNNLFYLNKNYNYQTGSVNVKYSNNYASDIVSFSGGARAAKQPVEFLSEVMQKRVGNIHTNLSAIQEFFKPMVTNPVKASKIRKGFSSLIPSNRPGIVFKTDDNEILTISRGVNNKSLLKLSVQKGKDVSHYYLEGYDKVIGNINQNNPTKLPRKVKYMTKSELDNSRVLEYIEVADKKISEYVEYLNTIKPIKKSIQVNSENVYEVTQGLVKNLIPFF